MLKAALAERQTPTKVADLRADMSVVDAGEFWLARIERPGSDLSPNTIAQYRATFDRLVKGSDVALLSLREVNRVPVLESFLQAVAERHGKGSAKTARSVVSSILTLAVRFDVLEGNRMRDVENPTVKPKVTARDADRAFTIEELRHVLEVTRCHQLARDFDLVDFLHFLAGSGARHSEALAVTWEDLSLWEDDGEPLMVGTAHMRGTKTMGADRHIPLPTWLTARLQSRAGVKAIAGLVFPAPGRWRTPGTFPRDRRNVTRQVRKILDDAGMPWATANTFRTTVGDLVTKTVNGTEAANILGHARPSMTYDRYSDRRQVSLGAVSALAAAVPGAQSGV